MGPLSGEARHQAGSSLVAVIGEHQDKERIPVGLMGQRLTTDRRC
jgi:hypothetical protein